MPVGFELRRNKSRLSIYVVLGLIALFPWQLATAQLSAPPVPQEIKGNSLGFGMSAGRVLERDARFWGWTLEYGRRVSERLVIAGSPAWDSETESVATKPDKTTRTYTLVGTVAYLLSNTLSLATGLGKGFADDDNPDRQMWFTSGDLSAGVVIGLATDGFPFLSRDSISFSAAFEHNLDQKENMLSFDVTFGWSF